MKKFLFVIFSINKLNMSWYVNISYLITAIKKVPGIVVDIRFFEPIHVKEAVEAVEELAPDYIGMSLIQKNYVASMEFANKIKEKLPDTEFVLGNIEASFMTEHIMKTYPEIDYIVKCYSREKSRKSRRSCQRRNSRI